ncbi:MAG TPA: hypothetical protein VLJ84_15290, partial [Usitatibacter sp.]|nr:hypothetical protein [Usitatibacter sp.]
MNASALAPAKAGAQSESASESTPTPTAVHRGKAPERGTPSGVQGISKVTSVEGITEYRVDA